MEEWTATMGFLIAAAVFSEVLFGGAIWALLPVLGLGLPVVFLMAEDFAPEL